jgi:hypothetical protein
MPGAHQVVNADSLKLAGYFHVRHFSGETPLLIEILKRTPSWVFVLFIALLALGYFQSKDRTLSRGKVLILPVAMIVLSFYGVISAFGVVPVGLIFWALGVAISVMLGVMLGTPQGVTFSAETKSFFVPGSWLPLAFMMSIFFTKYAAGVILARQLPIASTIAFVGLAGLLYGLFSGVFLARAFVIRHAARCHGQSHA